MDLKTEQEKLEKLRAENERAKSDYHMKLESDAVRDDGSIRQDTLHEQGLRKKRDRAQATSVALEAQKKVVAELLEG